MAFDGFITKSVVNELKNNLISGKITKIYQPTKDELIMGIYSNNNKYYLNICINSANCRINLTSNKKTNPINPTSFCMLLRKHLSGSKIINIETLGLDRLITITFECCTELNDIINKKLIIELMGKHSNIILINNNNIIIDSCRHIVSERNILPANPYLYPISEKIDITNFSFDEFSSIIKNNLNDFTNYICSTFCGFSKTYLNYIIKILNININNITNQDIHSFYNYIKETIANINTLHVTCKNIEFNNKNDYTIVKSENKSNLDINKFIDNYYYKKEKNEFFQNYKNNALKIILTILKKYEKRLININYKLEECKNMNDYKLFGELITANLYNLNNNINLDNITLNNYYDNNKPININLDKRYSLSVNANLFFKKYNKLKNTLNIVSEQKEETKKELDYIESIIYSLNNATQISEIDDIYLEIQENILNKNSKRKKENKSVKQTSAPITLEIDGYTVYIGKNNRQNDYLTFKIASKNDIWFHAKDIHGSHVILKLNSNELINESIINKCASIAAYYSKSRESSKVLVEYTFVKNIKKPKNSKPGFVTFSNYKTVLVQPKNNFL